MTDTATASALIDSAEGLFASDGFERASLRAVMREAGTDPGAVHYHFGGREGLAIAVLDRILVPLNDRRLELLEVLESRDETPQPAALIEALVRPDVEAAHSLHSNGVGRARLVGAIYLHPAAFVTAQVEQRFAPVAMRFHPHLIRAIPHVSPDMLGWRVRWCVFGTVGAVLADTDELLCHEPDELVRRLVHTLTPAITAQETP